LDIENLVTALGDESPSGPDLSYDSGRQEIEAAFEAASAEGSDDAEIDWRGTIKLIIAQAEVTRDLWLPVYLMRAAARVGNLDQVLDGGELLARLVEERWPDVHPQLDEYGFIGRKTPCESLTRIGEFLAPFQRVPLLEHPRLGRYGGEDFVRFHKEGSSAANYGMFRALIEATSPDDLQQIVDRLGLLRGAIKRVDAVLTANADGDTGTNFTPTFEMIDKITQGVLSQIPGREAPAGESDADASSGGGSAGAPGMASGGNAGPAFSGGITSRDDVIRALDAIAAYYSRCEPTSPVPLVLRRAKEWISLDFMAVLEDIAPGSLDEAKRVLISNRSNATDGAGSSHGGSSDSVW
jgi:type VI secretion system protein ImpA